MNTEQNSPIENLRNSQQVLDNLFKNAPNNSDLSNQAFSSLSWSPELIKFLSLSVLIFTFSALVLGSILLWRHRAQGNHILRVFGVITIIGMSALLLVVGYSDAQLTPIVGLFGAIAGYLLGKDSNQEKTPS